MNKQAMAVMTNITESQGEGGEQLENAFAAVAILTCEVWCGRGGGVERRLEWKRNPECTHTNALVHGHKYTLAKENERKCKGPALLGIEQSTSFSLGWLPMLLILKLRYRGLRCRWLWRWLQTTATPTKDTHKHRVGSHRT